MMMSQHCIRSCQSAVQSPAEWHSRPPHRQVIRHPRDDLSSDYADSLDVAQSGEQKRAAPRSVPAGSLIGSIIFPGEEEQLKLRPSEEPGDRSGMGNEPLPPAVDVRSIVALQLSSRDNADTGFDVTLSLNR